MTDPPEAAAAPHFEYPRDADRWFDCETPVAPKSTDDLWVLRHQILPNQYGLKYVALKRVLNKLETEAAAVAPGIAPQSEFASKASAEYPNKAAPEALEPPPPIRPSTQSIAPGIAPREPLRQDDIDQIIEGIEHFIIGPVEDPELRELWQPYIDKLQRAGEAEHEIRTLRRDSEILRRCNIVEIAVANETGSVSDYINHWEGRALKAEADVAKLLDETRLLREKIQLGIRDAEQLSADNATLREQLAAKTHGEADAAADLVEVLRREAASRAALIALRDNMQAEYNDCFVTQRTTQIWSVTLKAWVDALTQAAGLPK